MNESDLMMLDMILENRNLFSKDRIDKCMSTI